MVISTVVTEIVAGNPSSLEADVVESGAIEDDRKLAFVVATGSRVVCVLVWYMSHGNCTNCMSSM
jgi:hypothetical protein